MSDISKTGFKISLFVRNQTLLDNKSQKKSLEQIKNPRAYVYGIAEKFLLLAIEKSGFFFFFFSTLTFVKVT